MRRNYLLCIFSMYSHRFMRLSFQRHTMHRGAVVAVTAATRVPCRLIHASAWWRRPRGEGQSPSSTYCVDLVRRRDHEGYLCSLLLPTPSSRQAAFALRALNAEVSAVRDSVGGDRNLGQMRLKFWSDAVEAALDPGGAAPPQHPVAVELQQVSRRNPAMLDSRDLLLKVVHSRMTVLSDKPFGTLDELDAYSRDAFSSLNQVVVECCLRTEEGEEGELKSSGHARHASVQLGMAQGAVAMIRAIPHDDDTSRRRRGASSLLLPSDLMAELNAKQETEGLRLVVEAVAARAQDHLNNCRFRQRYLTRRQRLALLPATAVDGFLHALQQAGCDPMDARLRRRNAWLPLALFYKKWTNSY